MDEEHAAQRIALATRQPLIRIKHPLDHKLLGLFLRDYAKELGKYIKFFLTEPVVFDLRQHVRGQLDRLQLGNNLAGLEIGVVAKMFLNPAKVGKGDVPDCLDL